MISRPRVECAIIALALYGCSPNKPQEPVASDSQQVFPDSPERPPPNPVPQKMEARTIWEGVYTKEQSRRGKEIYASSCVRCHGEELEGDDLVSELVGDKFLNRWSRKRAGNLFSYMKNEMPPKLKDRLPPSDYADVLAYLLNRNQAPVGEEELGTDFEALMMIRMAKDE